MPARMETESLLELSLNAVCTNIEQLIVIGNSVVDASYDILTGTKEKFLHMLREFPQYLLRNAKELIDLGDAFDERGHFQGIVTDYIKTIPPVFLNEIFNRLLSNLTLIQVNEFEIEEFLNDRWSWIKRIRYRFHLILKSILSSKVSVMNISPISNYLYRAIVEYLIDKVLMDSEILEMVEEKSKSVFLPAIIECEPFLGSLTTLSLQNMAYGPLIRLISSNCSNLWHLDISGDLFDLQRYFLTKTNDEDCRGADKCGRKLYEKADFLNSLCSLYGGDDRYHDVYGRGAGCYVLKSLKLPNVKWEREEEIQLLCESLKLLQQLPELEEFEGVDLLHTMSKLNQLPYPPVMLKLKKFSNKPGTTLFKVKPRQLKTVHLPLVTEVEFMISPSVPLATLKIFPNMRHLSLTSYIYDSSSFKDITKYLTNLESLNLEVMHELSVENVCELAEYCPHLESLKLTCPALKTELQEFGVETEEDKIEEDSHSPRVKIDQLQGDAYECHEPFGTLNIFPKYYNNLRSIIDSLEYNDSFVPKLSNLDALRLYGMQSVDAAALSKCVQGCPNLRTLEIGMKEKDPNCNIKIDDSFIGQVMCRLKNLENFNLFADSAFGQTFVFKGITVMSVGYILNFCRNICSIGTIGNWNVTAEEVKSLNYFFKKNNFVLRLE
ncbi:uncharacterized protein LOC134779918 [Penaeus indicus]|uniref:uncharacterized protein LOC134779918 n=1 Tax=Penaeus indicus TaxID=29960 RepID=UPI00300D2285